MFKSLLVFAGVLAVALSQADKYPAGVHPALCPNYPHCDNLVLAAHAHITHPVSPVARSYPAGVSPASCPNYPYCNVHARALPLPGFSERLYPAGVHPSACPGYPYC